MAEQEPLPASIEYLIKNMLDSNQDVWRRQPFRQRLARMRDLIDEKIVKYDAEYTKANRNVTPFKRASK
jgi:hypothetical protein